MIRLQYTMTVECRDGITRTFEREFPFPGIREFFRMLTQWDGCNGPRGTPYRYFVTGKQMKANLLASGWSYL